MKDFFKPTAKKIILTPIILVVLFLVFGMPVEMFPFCELGGYCPKSISFIGVSQFFESLEFIGSGIWIPWHIYLIEIIISYIIASVIVSLHKRKK